LHAAVIESNNMRRETVTRQVSSISQFTEEVFILNAAQLCLHGPECGSLFIANLHKLRLAGRVFLTPVIGNTRNTAAGAIDKLASRHVVENAAASNALDRFCNYCLCCLRLISAP